MTPLFPAIAGMIWAECIVGAVPEAAYLDVIREAGFENLKVIRRIDYFARSLSDSTKKAARQFGASSITLSGIRN